MIHTQHRAILIFFLYAQFALLVAGNYAYAASCSPGIPCTNYDIVSNPNSGTNPTYNALKTGQPAPYTEGACDGNFMNQIYSRAYMEASRDLITAESLIQKPDSVLEYTCFDQRISMAAHHADDIFSASQKWKDRTIQIWTADETTTTIINNVPVAIFPDQTSHSVFENDRLDHILEAFLFNSLQNYIDGNFPHTFLGGATTLDNTLDTTAIGSAGYNCSHMSTVWNIAKCIDFGEDDKFYTFSNLVNYDPRQLPKSCSPASTASAPTPILTTPPCPAPNTTPPADIKTGFTDDHIRLANNCDDPTLAGPTTIDSDYAYAKIDSIKTYAELIKGFGNYAAGTGGGSGAITCSAPIPTGVPVISYSYTKPSYAKGAFDSITRTTEFNYDYVCPNPGCYYEPNKVPYKEGDPLPSPSVGQCKPFK